MTQDSLGVSRERPYEDDIMLIDSYEIINVVRKALSFIDPRLIDHGERVAFITRQIIETDPSGCGVDPGYLFVLSALHDVGAYKTDEIDDMVNLGSLRVLEPYRNRGYGRKLASSLIAKVLATGKTPMIHIIDSNIASRNLSMGIGFKPHSKKIFWGSGTKK